MQQWTAAISSHFSFNSNLFFTVTNESQKSISTLTLKKNFSRGIFLLKSVKTSHLRFHIGNQTKWVWVSAECQVHLEGWEFLFGTVEKTQFGEAEQMRLIAVPWPVSYMSRWIYRIWLSHLSKSEDDDTHIVGMLGFLHKLTTALIRSTIVTNQSHYLVSHSHYKTCVLFLLSNQKLLLSSICENVSLSDAYFRILGSRTLY